jgi:hypothetical protein
MLWEFRHLAESSGLNKTLALMPPKLLRQGKIYPRSWEHTRLCTSEFCVDLPVYDNRGAVVTFELIEGRWQGTAILHRKGLTHKHLAGSLIEAATAVAARFGIVLLQR